MQKMYHIVQKKKARPGLLFSIGDRMLKYKNKKRTLFPRQMKTGYYYHKTERNFRAGRQTSRKKEPAARYHATCMMR